jgi:hypothetical protein
MMLKKKRGRTIGSELLAALKEGSKGGSFAEHLGFLYILVKI